jgi:site-specific DNA recombinase
VDVETFERAQTVRRARGAADERSPRRTPRPYALHGVVRCGVCGRRIQGSWNNGAAYYRCVFLSQYAAKNKLDHPRSVYPREDQILPRLDDWLTTKFSPGRLPVTVRELEDAQDHTEAPADAGSEAAKQEIADCDARLRQHRAALEAGADPEIVTGWINEIQAKRAAAEARLRQRPAARRRMAREEITNMIKALGDLMTVLSEADPADKAEVYGQLGLTLTYDPAARRVKAEARPESIMYVGTCPRPECTKKPMRPDR